MLLVVLLLPACASVQEPPLSRQLQVIDLNGRSIGFFSLRLSNQYKKHFQPKADFFAVHTHRKNETHRVMFKVEEAHQVGLHEKEYLLSFEVMPGDYLISEVVATFNAVLLYATFKLPIARRVSLEPGTINYFGHFNAQIVERTSEEQPRAGALVPLNAQEVAGASGGTVVVERSDNFEQDLQKAVALYPALAELEILNRSQIEQAELAQN